MDSPVNNHSPAGDGSDTPAADGNDTAAGPLPPGLTVYRGRIVTPVDWHEYREFRKGALVVDNRGMIVACGDWTDIQTRFDGAQVVDFGPRMILPGFIDLHVHLVQLAQTGRAGDTLLGWLNKYIFPEEARFADSQHARKLARWFFTELARNGTTLAAVFTSIHAEATDIAFQTAAQAGSRVIMGKVMMDRNSPPELTERTEESLSQSQELCGKWHGYDDSRILYAFTPRFAPTSSPELLRGAASLWRQHPGSYMQTHLSENVDEIKWMKELFPDFDSYFDVYRQHGVSGSNALFAHAIHLSPEEIDAVASTNSSLVHCPSSNFFLKSGVFPFGLLQERCVKFGLGSDVAAGPEMSMMRVMKDAAYMQQDIWISPAELLYLSTLGGARAANLDQRLGSFETGKEADFIVVDPSLKTGVVNDILEHDSQDVLSSMIYVGDDRMVVATFVRGRPIYIMEGTDVSVAVSPSLGAWV